MKERIGPYDAVKTLDLIAQYDNQYPDIWTRPTGSKELGAEVSECSELGIFKNPLSGSGPGSGPWNAGAKCS